IACGPLRRMTARAPRPLGVDSATIVVTSLASKFSHKEAQKAHKVFVILESDGRGLGVFLRTDSQLAVGSFTDRFSEQVRAISKRQVNDPSFVGGHWLKRESHSGLSHTIGSQICHGLQFSFTRRAKTIHITNKSLTTSKVPAKNLINQMLQRLKQFASLRLKQFGILACDVEHWTCN